MKTREKTPDFVDPMKVFDWTEKTPLNEGIVIIYVFLEEGEKQKIDWLLFFAWCYARTQGFTNKCMRNWDYGNFGGMFKTSRDGIRDALSEFIKYEDTSAIPEQVEVEKLYTDICNFCQGVVWTEPKPLPEPSEPEPIPGPIPQEPSEEPKQDEQPKAPSKPTNWKKIAAIVLPILGLVATFGGVFLPGWAKLILDSVMKILGGLTQ